MILSGSTRQVAAAAEQATITAVNTAANSGLSGGVTTGAADLRIDTSSLVAFSDTTLNASDRFPVEDDSDASDPIKALSVGVLASFMAGGSSTIDATGGRLMVPNDGIDTDQIADQAVETAQIRNGAVIEQKLDATNTPTNGQFLTYGGGNRFTWVNAPSGGTGDITAVNTPDAGGLSGGVTSGAATLTLISAALRLFRLPIFRPAINL